MRKLLHSAFKAYMHDVLLRTRYAMRINQEEMAHILSMSTRAYAAVEAGASAFGLMTFVIFVLKCCPNRKAFLDDLFDALDKTLNAANTAA